MLFLIAETDLKKYVKTNYDQNSEFIQQEQIDICINNKKQRLKKANTIYSTLSVSFSVS